MEEILSGGLTWGSIQQAIVTMDKEGHPLTCCNPVTGECLGGGGSSDFSTAEITVRLDEAAGSPEFVVACVEIPNNDYKTGFYLNEDYGISTENEIVAFSDITQTVNYYIKQNSFISLILRGCTLNTIEGSAEAATFEGNKFIKIYGNCVISANVIK